MCGFLWVQLVILDGYGTIVGRHVHWKRQNGLEVMLEAKRLCTNLAETDCKSVSVHIFNNEEYEKNNDNMSIVV